jgi:hypothetical protein
MTLLEELGTRRGSDSRTDSLEGPSSQHHEVVGCEVEGDASRRVRAPRQGESAEVPWLTTKKRWIVGSPGVASELAVHSRHVAKKIALALLIVLVLLGGGLGWLWMRLTALPDWYESGELVAEDGTPRVDPDWVAIPSEASEPRRYQIRNPHLRPLKADTKPSPVRKAIKGSRAIWADDGTKQELDAGAVINLSEMDLDELNEVDRESYRKAIDAFPALTGRDVYVGIEGEVGKQGDQLKLGPDTQLRIGDTHYSLKTAAKRLGMTESQLRASIEKELGKLDVHPPPGE